MPARSRLPRLATRVFASHHLQLVRSPHQVAHHGADLVELEGMRCDELRLGDKSGNPTGEELMPVGFRSELLQHEPAIAQCLATSLIITKIPHRTGCRHRKPGARWVGGLLP